MTSLKLSLSACWLFWSCIDIQLEIQFECIARKQLVLIGDISLEENWGTFEDHLRQWNPTPLLRLTNQTRPGSPRSMIPFPLQVKFQDQFARLDGSFLGSCVVVVNLWSAFEVPDPNPMLILVYLIQQSRFYLLLDFRIEFPVSDESEGHFSLSLQQCSD